MDYDLDNKPDIISRKAIPKDTFNKKAGDLQMKEDLE